MFKIKYRTSFHRNDSNCRKDARTTIFQRATIKIWLRVCNWSRWKCSHLACGWFFFCVCLPISLCLSPSFFKNQSFDVNILCVLFENTDIDMIEKNSKSMWMTCIEHWLVSCFIYALQFFVCSVRINLLHLSHSVVLNQVFRHFNTHLRKKARLLVNLFKSEKMYIVGWVCIFIYMKANMK